MSSQENTEPPVESLEAFPKVIKVVPEQYGTVSFSVHGIREGQKFMRFSVVAEVQSTLGTAIIRLASGFYKQSSAEAHAEKIKAAITGNGDITSYDPNQTFQPPGTTS